MRNVIGLLLSIPLSLWAYGQSYTPPVLSGKVDQQPWFLYYAGQDRTSGEDTWIYDVGPLLEGEITISPVDTSTGFASIAMRCFDLQWAYQYQADSAELELISLRKKTEGAVWTKFVEDLSGSFPPIHPAAADHIRAYDATVPDSLLLPTLLTHLTKEISWVQLDTMRDTLWEGRSALGPYTVYEEAWQHADYRPEIIYTVSFPERSIALPLRLDQRQVQVVTHLMNLTYHRNSRTPLTGLKLQAASSLRLELITMIQQMQGFVADTNTTWEAAVLERAAVLLHNSLKQPNPMLFYHLTLPVEQGGNGYPTTAHRFELPTTDWYFLGYPTWWYPVAYAAPQVIHSQQDGWVHEVSIGRGLDHPLPYSLNWTDAEEMAEDKLAANGWIPQALEKWTHPLSNHYTLTVDFDDTNLLQRVSIAQSPYQPGLQPAVPLLVNRFDEVFLTLVTLYASGSENNLDSVSMGRKLCPVGFQRDSIPVPANVVRCVLAKGYPQLANTYAKRIHQLLPAEYQWQTTTDTLSSSETVYPTNTVAYTHTFSVLGPTPNAFLKQTNWPLIQLGNNPRKDQTFLLIKKGD